MNYSEAKEHLQEVTNNQGMVFGLDTMRNLLEKLNNPQNIPAVHIAGTNGKGSLCTFISQILITAGYTVGRYMSPSVGEHLEIITVNGHNISKEEYAGLYTRVVDTARDNELFPTAFEIETAVAFLYFSKMKCSIMVIECGLGGRLDATNVITTTCVAAFASIGLDHMRILGSCIEDIAKEKAGIIKENVIAVAQNTENGVIKQLETACQENKASLIIADKITDIHISNIKTTFNYGNLKNVCIYQPGFYQIKNAAQAIEVSLALRHLGYKISDSDIYEGLKSANIHFRYETVCQKPLIILDGAHNENAVKALINNLKLQFKDRKLIFVMGIFADKDYDTVTNLILPYAKEVVTITPPNKRALPAKELGRIISEKAGDDIKVRVSNNIDEAVHYILQNDKNDDIIIAFGSLSYLKDIRQLIEARTL